MEIIQTLLTRDHTLMLVVLWYQSKWWMQQKPVTVWKHCPEWKKSFSRQHQERKSCEITTTVYFPLRNKKTGVGVCLPPLNYISTTVREQSNYCCRAASLIALMTPNSCLTEQMLRQVTNKSEQMVASTHAACSAERSRMTVVRTGSARVDQKTTAHVLSIHHTALKHSMCYTALMSPCSVVTLT